MINGFLRMCDAPKACPKQIDPRTGAVYGVALNFKGAIEALGRAVHQDPYQRPPRAPVLYIKPANTWIANGDVIPCPSGVASLRMGGTLGVVISRSACRVREKNALDHIGGYTIVNDVSVPHESYYRPAIRQKCRDGFCPIGPRIIDSEALSSPDSVEIRISVNGELRSLSTTANLIRPLARLMADITEFLTLRSGDLLLVGEPADSPLAAPGDRVSVEIDGIGRLDNSIVSEAEVG